MPVAAAEDFIASLVRKSDIRDYLMRNIYAALTPDEQLVMSALAVFPGPIERSGVEELLADEAIDGIAQHIDALVNKHVLSIDRDERIDCHKLVREYCYHILNRRERDRFHQRAAEYFTQEQNWMAAAHHHLERRAYDDALDTLTPRAEALINTGQAAALSELLQRFDAANLARRATLPTVSDAGSRPLHARRISGRPGRVLPRAGGGAGRSRTGCCSCSRSRAPTSARASTNRRCPTSNAVCRRPRRCPGRPSC